MTFACNKLRSKVNNLKINIFVPKITLEYEHLRLIWKLFTTTLKQVMSRFGWFHLNFAASGNIFNIKWFYINWKMVSIFYIKEPFIINLRNETQYFYPGEKNRNIKHWTNYFTGMILGWCQSRKLSPTLHGTCRSQKRLSLMDKYYIFCESHHHEQKKLIL